jgi:hypothetical protein
MTTTPEYRSYLNNWIPVFTGMTTKGCFDFFYPQASNLKRILPVAGL